MSHFTVLVVGENPEEQLAPYAEQGREDPHFKKYFKFKSTEKEDLKEYKTGSTEQVVLSNGKTVYPWDEQFRVPGTFGSGSDTHKVPENLIKRDVPYTEIYKTFSEFMDKYKGYPEKDPEKGEYGFWHNPKAKWDWYSLGGRWTGFFKMKSTLVGVAGRPGLMTEVAKEGYADQALKKDIDFNSMRQEAGDKAAKRYDQLSRILGGVIEPLKVSWNDLRSKKKYKSLDIDEKRAIYHDQDPLKKIKALREGNTLFKDDMEFLSWLEYEDYCISRGAYIKNASDKACSTFALVRNGKWFERGEMGWWGVVHNEKEDGKWDAEFTKLFNKASDDTLLSVYDCHI